MTVMNMETSNERLNDILVEIHRSLVQYAAEAWPWTNDQDEELKGTVLSIAEQQREDVGRLAKFLNRRGHYVDFGVYPPEYTSLHYVAMDYLYSQLLENQKAIVRDIDHSGEAFLGDEQARVLAQQIGTSQREALEKLRSVSLPGGNQAISWMK